MDPSIQNIASALRDAGIVLSLEEGTRKAKEILGINQVEVYEPEQEQPEEQSSDTGIEVVDIEQARSSHDPTPEPAIQPEPEPSVQPEPTFSPEPSEPERTESQSSTHPPETDPWNHEEPAVEVVDIVDSAPKKQSIAQDTATESAPDEIPSAYDLAHPKEEEVAPPEDIQVTPYGDDEVPDTSGISDDPIEPNPAHVIQAKQETLTHEPRQMHMGDFKIGRSQPSSSHDDEDKGFVSDDEFDAEDEFQPPRPAPGPQEFSDEEAE